MERWSKERAWEWYNSRPWIRGCNYMSADCVNRIDQWQGLHFEERLATTKEELKVMKELGFNSVRIILEYVVWEKEHDSFLERFERYISLLDEFGISAPKRDVLDHFGFTEEKLYSKVLEIIKRYGYFIIISASEAAFYFNLKKLLMNYYLHKMKTI